MSVVGPSSRRPYAPRTGRRRSAGRPASAQAAPPGAPQAAAPSPYGPDGKLLYTVEDVERVLSISRRTIYRLIDQGRLPRVYVMGSPRFRPVDCVALVEELVREQLGARAA